MPTSKLPLPDIVDVSLPLGEPCDAGATLQTFVERHARVRDAQADVIRGLLGLASVTQRIVNAVPDLCWNPTVARGQRTLAYTLNAAVTAYLALHGRRLVKSPASKVSVSEQLLAASPNDVNDWLCAVATPPSVGRIDPAQDQDDDEAIDGPSPTR